jgi:hypothetical protein
MSNFFSSAFGGLTQKYFLNNLRWKAPRGALPIRDIECKRYQDPTPVSKWHWPWPQAYELFSSIEAGLIGDRIATKCVMRGKSRRYVRLQLSSGFGFDPLLSRFEPRFDDALTLLYTVQPGSAAPSA